MKKAGAVAMVVALAALAGCQGEVQAPARPSWTAKGKIVALDAEQTSVTIDHQNISGLMDAMTMAFAVDDAAVLEGIAEGDAVEFVLEQKARGLTVTKLAKIDAAALEAATEPTVRGTVILVNEATVSLMVRNDAVPGFLEPDDRVFGVNPASLLEGLEENDRVEFTLTERESGALVITALRKLEE